MRSIKQATCVKLTGNRTESVCPSLMYVANLLTLDEANSDCDSQVDINKGAGAQCRFFAFMRFVNGVLIYPTVMFAFTFEILLFALLIKRVVWHVKQTTYGIATILCNLLFVIGIGIIYLAVCRGLPWHGVRGKCWQTKSDLSCQFTRFLNTLTIGFMANILCMQTLNQALYLKFSGQIPPTTSRGLIIASVILAVAFALPDLYLSDLFLVAGNLHCGTTTKYPKLVIAVAEIHRTLFGHGVVQICFTLFSVRTISGREKVLNNSIKYLYSSLQPSNQLAVVVDELCEVLRYMRRTARIVQIYSAMICSLLLIRECACLLISLYLYQNREDKLPIAFRRMLLTLIDFRDLISYLIVLLIGFHFWIYYYYLPSVRISLSIHRNVKSTASKHRSIINVDPDPFALENRLVQLLQFIKTVDQNTYRNVASLRPAIAQLAKFRDELTKTRNHVKPGVKTQKTRSKSSDANLKKRRIKLSRSTSKVAK